MGTTAEKRALTMTGANVENGSAAGEMPSPSRGDKSGERESRHEEESD